MIRLLITCLLLLLMVTACYAGPQDVIACEMALASMTPDPDVTPEVCALCNGTGWITHGDGHKTPCPECSDGDLYGGPLDTVRQVKELIRRGDELTAWGLALKQQADNEGKVTIDIRLPGSMAIAPPPIAAPPNEAPPNEIARIDCTGDVCQLGDCQACQLQRTPIRTTVKAAAKTAVVVPRAAATCTRQVIERRPVRRFFGRIFFRR